jgi:hypothetical protein
MSWQAHGGEFANFIVGSRKALRCLFQQLESIHGRRRIHWTLITVRAVKLEFDAAIPTLLQAIFSLLSLLSAACRIQRAVKTKAHQWHLVRARSIVCFITAH